LILCSAKHTLMWDMLCHKWYHHIFKIDFKWSEGLKVVNKWSRRSKKLIHKIEDQNFKKLKLGSAFYYFIANKTNMTWKYWKMNLYHFNSYLSINPNGFQMNYVKFPNFIILLPIKKIKNLAFDERYKHTTLIKIYRAW